jgi:hypothetical protein
LSRAQENGRKRAKMFLSFSLSPVGFASGCR